jgi:RHS repeat-associated protein
VYAATDTVTPFLMVTTDRGDVRELLDTEHNAFAFYAYDAYGNPTVTSSAATGGVSATTASRIATRQPLRYAGYSWDAYSKLYYCSQRYYDPSVAAFISKDPARADGEESAYQYCAGEPVGLRDETGLHASDYPTGKDKADSLSERKVWARKAVYHLLDRHGFRQYTDAGLIFAMAYQESGLNNGVRNGDGMMLVTSGSRYDAHAPYKNTPRSIFENVSDALNCFRYHYGANTVTVVSGGKLAKSVHAAWHYNGGNKPYGTYAKGDGDRYYLEHVANRVPDAAKLAGHGFPALRSKLLAAQKLVNKKKAPYGAKGHT